MQLQDYIDQTLLKSTATTTDIKSLCKEAIQHSFYAICVHGCHTALAKRQLNDSKIKLATVVGFPLGATSTATKVFETKDCLANGADEIDMVINIGWLKSGDHLLLKEEIRQVKEVMGDAILKVILETCYLTDAEKRIACEMAVSVGADFIKTSTGFGTGGATLDDIALIKDVVGDQARIKASGGIRDRATALQYISMGVSRIGTSSGVAIVTSEQNQQA